MVPTTATVRAGARVAIILKHDQPTGHLSYGSVQTLLTRGNHPRGIKVRLADGRVGRVQRVLEGDSDQAAAAQQETAAGQAAQEGATSRQQQRYRHQRDIRLDDEYLFGASEASQPRHELGDFVVKPARTNKKKGQSAAALAKKNEEQATKAKCPVCGEFEGDEPAVAHHVAEHFSEAPCA